MESLTILDSLLDTSMGIPHESPASVLEQLIQNRFACSLRLWRPAARLLFLFAGLHLLIPCVRGTQKNVTGSGEDQTARPEYLNTRAGVLYLGSRACAPCHQQVYDKYRLTHMGRSMSEARGPSIPAGADARPTIFDSVSNLHFQVFLQGQDLYQSVYGSDAENREVFRHTEKIAYSIGSGVNGISFLVRKGDLLLQAPLAFYIKTHTWDLAPGYRGHDIGFSRAISARCISCHSGLSRPVAGRNGLYQDPPFQELAIGCENCHGPGQLHVEAQMKGEKISGDFDRTIVNPAKLPPWLATDLCMYCHEDGDSQVVKPGKSLTDVRPGVPLDEIVALFRLRPERNSQATPELLDRYGEMMSSKCYNSSRGRLSCLTCHDPHGEPQPDEAVDYYRSKCLTCHTDKSCGIPLPVRLGAKPSNDCAGCHMLKQRVAIPHSSVTNHRIVAKQGEPDPEFLSPAENSALQDLVHLDVLPGEENIVPSPEILLQAYRQILLSRRDARYVDNYLAILRKSSPAESKNPAYLSALAVQASLGRKPAGIDRAIQLLKQALALGSTDSLDYTLLGEFLLYRERPAEAVSVLRAGLELDPCYIPYYQLLAKSYVSLGSLPDAADVVTHALQQFPESRALREDLEKLRKDGISP
jgi:hypothetical protein